MNEPNPYAPTADVNDSPYPTHQGGLPLATRWQRFAGAFADGFIQMLVVIPAAFVLGIAVGTIMGDTPATAVVAQILGGLMGVGVFLAINGYFLATQGKTIGKMLVKTRIVDRDTDQLVPFWPLILKRYAWIWVISMIPYISIILLIDVLMIFRANKACLHDDIANTKVVADG